MDDKARIQELEHALHSVQGLYALDRVIPDERDAIRLYFPCLGDSEDAKWERQYQELLPKLGFDDLAMLQDAVKSWSIHYAHPNLLEHGLLEPLPKGGYCATKEGRRVAHRYWGTTPD